MFAEHSAKVRADSGFAGRGTAPGSSNGRATVIGFIVGSIIGAVIVLVVWRATAHRRVGYP